MSTSIEKIQTPRGMIILLAILTMASIGVGVALIFLYKKIGIQDEFAQGSGSLVQAVWGSAATIAASVLAIILATEALRMARRTNDLTEISNDLTAVANKFQETESEPYSVWIQHQDALLALDQYSITVKPLLGKTEGKITNDNVLQFECITYLLLEKLNAIYRSPVYHMLNQIAWRPGIDMSFPNTYATPLVQTILFTYNYKERAEKTPEHLKNEFHNSTGRAIWLHLFDIRKGLMAINLANIKDFMDESVGYNWTKDMNKLKSGMKYLPLPPDYSKVLQDLRDLIT